MPFLARLLPAAFAAAIFSGCAGTPKSPPPDTAEPGRKVMRLAASRLTAVVISSKAELSPWVESRFTSGQSPDDADGGSAAPISYDGYFITADHVLARSEGRNVFLIHGQQGGLKATKARIVWRSASTDLAVLHIPIATPRYYEWTPPNEWVPAGTPVVHAGIATGFRSEPGKLVTGIPPGRKNAARFKYDIPLEPGDSGGAVIDAHGRLVGINSAVEFLVPLETAFFIESEANRPNVPALQRMIEADRKKNPTVVPSGPPSPQPPPPPASAYPNPEPATPPPAPAPAP
ncbi:serine protease [Haloferula sp. BvORR071]|uniref:S1 family peptidase n=1 Tax=Haloferula sp. BvORR071 TaxID=1396141 RepID=UPI0005543AA7|nr:serine protease [Haloferula sp. BvORR071]